MRSALCLLLLFPVSAWAQSEEARARITADVKAGRPLVVHVHVALCDNDAQGISPVSRTLGDGQNLRTNLYWGARYGVRTFLLRDGGWKKLKHESTPAKGVLERLVLKKRMGKRSVYLVADAWDGRRIKETTKAFLRAAAGHDTEVITFFDEVASGAERAQKKTITAGGSSHVVTYVGHNGLMDFELPPPPASPTGARSRSAIVLGCASKQYFAERLQRAGAHPLLLTTNLMAPEAYTLDAALGVWLAGGTPRSVHRAAGKAYCKYQKCSARVGKRLFYAAP